MSDMMNDQLVNDQASVSSSSSDESSEEEEEEGLRKGGLSLLEKRALNVERNKAFLNSLGLLKTKKKDLEPGLEKEHESGNPETKLEGSTRGGGILLPPWPSPNKSTRSTSDALSSSPVASSYTSSYFQQVQDILFNFPGRADQVHQLAALLLNGQSAGIPIFVTGSSGTGKTDLVQRICKTAVAIANQTPRSNRSDNDPSTSKKVVVVYTHVNIATSRDAWIRQIHQSVQTQLHINESNKSRKRKRPKQKNPEKKKSKSLTDSHAGPTKGESNEERQEEKEEDNERRYPLRSQRAVSSADTISSMTKQVPKPKRVSKATAEDMVITVQDDSTPAAASSNLTAPQPLAMHSLGRFLQQSLLSGHPYGEHDKRERRMILVIDQAEFLFADHGKRASNMHPNALAQLLLLPRTMGLTKHLTILVISNSLLLGRTSTLREHLIRDRLSTKCR